MSGGNNPISMRFPLQMGENVDPAVAAQIRYVTSGIVDLNQAIAALKGILDSLQTSVTNIQSTINTVTPTPPTPSPFPYLGSVNDQVGVTAYTIQPSDCGAKIVFGNSSPITLTLDATVGTPWFACIDNDSSATVTVTPTSGTINGENYIPSYASGIIFFDGTNWWASEAVSGEGTFGYIPKWSSSGQIANSHIDDGVTTAATVTVNENLTIVGNTRTQGFLTAYIAVTTPYAIQPADYQIECTANSFTVTLPTAVGITGQEYSIKNTGTGTITLATTSSQTIDGSLTQTLAQWDNMQVMSNGANWIIR